MVVEVLATENCERRWIGREKIIQNASDLLLWLEGGVLVRRVRRLRKFVRKYRIELVGLAANRKQ